MARADRVVPGVWRLRLPLPWEGVPHVNAWALAAGGGVVLVDTGLDEPGALAQLERALGEAGLRLDHIKLVVCTHAHSDHYGLAGRIIDATGCELWMHPNHEHMARSARDPQRALERRIEVARQSGVPEAAIERYQEARRAQPSGIARFARPDRDLVEGVSIETDLGRFEVFETPGHAPSHVVLYQRERRLLVSGDHVLGRVSLYYDYGYTPDPAGEFLASLDVVERLDARLCIAGHGRPFRSVQAHIDANRRTVSERIERVATALSDGPRTAFELTSALMGSASPSAMTVSRGLSEALCYLRHLELGGAVARVDGQSPERWRAAA